MSALQKTLKEIKRQDINWEKTFAEMSKELDLNKELEQLNKVNKNNENELKI